jgi:hypothetical protein
MRLILVFIFFIFTLTSFASKNWEQVYFVTDQEDTWKICSPDSTDCLVLVNLYGFLKIIGTTNQGKTWDTVHNEVFYGVGDPWPTPTHPQNMAYPAKGYLYIIYDKGGMKISHDRAKTFDTIYFPTTDNLLFISMVDSITGMVATAQDIFITEDGFKTYELIDYKKGDKFIKDIFMHNINNFAFIDSHAYLGPKFTFTTDRGENWKEFKLDTQKTSLGSLFFQNSIVGWIAAAKYNNVGQQKHDVIYKTTDGGESWELNYEKENEPLWGLRFIKFCDSLNGIAVGQFGKILRTTDGGESWFQEWYNAKPDIGLPLFMSIGYIGKKPIIGVMSRGLIMRPEDIDGVDEVTISNLLVYPNPVTDFAYLKLDKEFTGYISISLVDFLGNIIQIYSGEACGGNSFNLDFSVFPPGFYSLIIDFGINRGVVKVIKE